MAHQEIGTENATGASFIDFLRWRRHRKQVIRAHKLRGERLPVPAPDPDAILRTTDDAAAWIGHATVLARIDGKNILFDPIWSAKAGGVVPRLTPPAFQPPPPRPDLVVVSHNHYDHLDAATLKLWRDVPIRVPRGDAAWFRRRRFKDVKELGWWDSSHVDGLDVTFVPSQHFAGRTLWDRNRSLWGGWVVEGKKTRTYHAGDTGYFPGFAEIGDRLGAPDLACLPIGAYEPRWFMKYYHTDPEEAGQAFLDLSARTFMPIHWGTFRLTDEAMDEPPERIQRFFQAKSLAPERLLLGDLGKVWSLQAEPGARLR